MSDQYAKLNDLLLKRRQINRQLAERYAQIGELHAQLGDNQFEEYNVRKAIDEGTTQLELPTITPIPVTSSQEVQPTLNAKTFSEFFEYPPTPWAIGDDDEWAKFMREAGVNVSHYFKCDDRSGSTRTFYLTASNEGVIVRKKHVDYIAYPPSANISHNTNDALLFSLASYILYPFYSREEPGDKGYHLLDLRDLTFNYSNSQVTYNGSEVPEDKNGFSIVKVPILKIK